MKFAIILVLTAISAFASSTRAETNAERLARGLQPRKPSRLYNPSRRGALLPRQSGSSGGMNIITTNPNVPPTRKRSFAHPQGYIGVGPNGNLIYSTNPSDAQYFFWGPGTDPTTLYWTATSSYSLAGIVQGTTYPVTAVHADSQPSGMATVWSLVVGSAHEGDTTIFTPARYPGDLNAQPEMMDYIFFSLGNFGLGDLGYIGLSNDYAAVVQWADGLELSPTPQEIILQTLLSTSTWDITSAMDFYQMGTKFVNPVTIYGTDATGIIQGYSVYDGLLQLQQTSLEVTTFYLPLLNAGMYEMPIIYQRNDLTCTMFVSGTAGTYAIYADIYTSTEDPYLGVHITGVQSGQLYFPDWFQTFGLGGSPSAVAVSTDSYLSYGNYPNAQPICLETLTVGGYGATPSVCSGIYTTNENNALQPGPNSYDDAMYLYLYDTESTNGYFNLAGPASGTGGVASFDQTPHTKWWLFMNGNTAQPYLYSYYQGSIVSLFTTSGNTGAPIAFPQSTAPGNFITFIAPATGQAGNARILLIDDSLSFFYQTSLGLSSVVVAAENPGDGWNILCAEMVPLTGSPSLCAP